MISHYTKYSNNVKHRDKPWWNDKLKRLWDIKRMKQKIYNNNKNLFTANELRNINEKLRTEIKISKKNRGTPSPQKLTLTIQLERFLIKLTFLIIKNRTLLANFWIVPINTKIF